MDAPTIQVVRPERSDAEQLDWCSPSGNGALVLCMLACLVFWSAVVAGLVVLL